MRKKYFLPDDNGKIIQCGMVDGDVMPDGAIETTEEMISAISLAGGFVRWHKETGQHSFPKDDMRLWKAIMSQGGHTGEGALHFMKLMADIKDAFPLDTPSDIDLTDGEFFQRPALFDPYSFSEVPGLSVRLFDLDLDFDNVMRAAVEAGVHTEEKWQDLAVHLNNPAYQDLLSVWNGKPIQLEIYDVKETTAGATRTIHFSKARPYWFWRELMKPVFSWLGDRGVEKFVSVVGTQRSDWMEALKRNFNARIIPIKENLWRIVFPLDPSIFQGWPTRKTLGSDWNRESNGTLVREMQEAEIPDIKQFISSAWGDSPREAPPLSMLDEWFHLDRAAILGGFVSGRLTWIRTMRFRKDGVASMANYIPMDEVQPNIFSGIHARMLDWTREVGYSKITYFIDKKLYDRNPAVHERLGSKIVALHTGYRAPSVELEISVP